MGFITAQYYGDIPILQSEVLFQTLSTLPSPKSGVSKYKIVLEDGEVWLVYAYSDSGVPLSLTVIDHGIISATSGYEGIIQVAKVVDGAESVYDDAAGAYPKGVRLTGEVNAATATYHFVFDKGGRADTTLLIFALPHHVDSFSSETKSAIVSNCQLQTTTKGLALGVLADTWTLSEPLPIDMGKSFLIDADLICSNYLRHQLTIHDTQVLHHGIRHLEVLREAIRMRLSPLFAVLP